MIRALVVDDERLARLELRRLLEQHAGVEIVGKAADADAAQEAVAELHPDLLLLDVQMPGASGFDLLERLDAPPPAILTTAYDEYALRAFEVSGLDYLLKPVASERLADALHRVRPRIAATRAAGEQPHLLTEDDQVFVRDGDRCWFVRVGDVRLFESEGNYTRLFFDDERPLIHCSLSYLEERLDPRAFFRASRQHLINLRYIERLTPWFNGGLKVRLEGGHEVTMSRRRARSFDERRRL